MGQGGFLWSGGVEASGGGGRERYVTWGLSALPAGRSRKCLLPDQWRNEIIQDNRLVPKRKASFPMSQRTQFQEQKP